MMRTLTAWQRAFNGQWSTHGILEDAFTDARVFVTAGDKVRHSPADASLAASRVPGDPAPCCALA